MLAILVVAVCAILLTNEGPLCAIGLENNNNPDDDGTVSATTTVVESRDLAKERSRQRDREKERRETKSDRIADPIENNNNKKQGRIALLEMQAPITFKEVKVALELSLSTSWHFHEENCIASPKNLACTQFSINNKNSREKGRKESWLGDGACV